MMQYVHSAYLDEQKARKKRDYLNAEESLMTSYFVVKVDLND